MPIFDFQATNARGDVVSGQVEADNESVGLQLIEEQGFRPISISPQKKGLQMDLNIDAIQPISGKEIVVMTRQLAVMIEANLPMVEALQILIRQTANPKLKRIVESIAEDVEGGARLSMSLKDYPKQFSQFYISIVKSGETSGQLSVVLNYLADQLEKDYDLRDRIRSAMMYPMFILFGLVGVGILMMIFVVPRMTEILLESGVALPLSTRILIFTSSWMENYWWLMIIIVVATVIGVKLGLRNKDFRYWFDWTKLHIPIFGKLFQRIAVVRMTQSLSTLTTGKVPLVDGLGIIKDIVGNAVYEELIEQTIDEVEDGNSIATVFAKSKDMPVMLSQMLSVGEQTGRLDDVLERLTDFYRREIDNRVANLVTLIEPIVMLVLGGAVGLMVAAIILPIYTLSTGV